MQHSKVCSIIILALILLASCSQEFTVPDGLVYPTVTDWGPWPMTASHVVFKQLTIPEYICDSSCPWEFVGLDQSYSTDGGETWVSPFSFPLKPGDLMRRTATFASLDHPTVAVDISMLWTFDGSAAVMLPDSGHMEVHRHAAQ